ncbi:unnamed protein product [Oncorhynchus mykiss]|uniref:N-acetyltransferase domain-containing protein n=1 Tax=Oncorhynchus mykiss TaxID=8022 RepID=A0A060W4D9_ONCMY|nr:unnamed protein product [Oncorhynchus mykiss]
MAGYVLGGSSYFMALLFGGAWAGLIYYCCYEIYEGYRLSRMATDMADIQASFLDNPDNGFWVAKAEVNGKSKVAGLVAVVMEFCKDRGFSRVVLETSSPQTAANALYSKLGFIQTSCHSNTHVNHWFSKLANIQVMHMEKYI